MMGGGAKEIKDVQQGWEAVLTGTVVQYCPEDLTPILVNFHDKSRASLRAVSTEKRISFFRCQVEQACSEGTRGPQF